MNKSWSMNAMDAANKACNKAHEEIQRKYQSNKAQNIMTIARSFQIMAFAEKRLIEEINRLLAK